MKPDLRGFLVRSLLAALAAALAVWLRWLLIPAMGMHSPYVFVFPVVMVVGMLWGKGVVTSGLLAGILGVEIFLIAPVGDPHLSVPSIVRMATLTFAALFCGHLGNRLRLAVTRANEQARLARESSVRLAAALRLQDEMARELGRSTALERAVARLTPDLIYVKDREGRYTYANAAMLDFCQREADAVFGRTDRDLFGPETGARLMEKDQQVFSAGETLICDEDLVVRGERFSFLSTRQLLRNESGEVLGLIGCSRNLTRSRQLEASLALQQARFAALVESIPVGICMVDHPEGKVVLANRHAVTLLGGSPVGEEFVFLLTDGNPVLPGRRALAGELLHGMEASLTRRDGRRISVRFSTAPVRDELGQILGGVVAFSGMDEEIRTKEELRRKVEELHALMEAVPAAIWVARDPGCHRIIGNRKANQFYEAEKGENVSAGPRPGVTAGPRRFFADGRELSADELPMQRAAATNREVHGAEFEVLLPSGQRRSLWGSAAPLRDLQGKVRGCVGAFLDITERKRAEDELRKATVAAKEASLAKSRFLAMVSHEIRTPLNAILGFAELLAEAGEVFEREEYSGHMRRCSEALVRLIDDILDLSKVEAGTLQIEKAPVNIRSLLHEVLVPHKHVANGKGIALKMTCDEDLPETILTDGVRLRQILGNIIGNAVKFTERGQVSLAVACEGARLRITVRDSGVGIAPESRERLFQPFAQADATIARRFGGTGLGLALSRRLAQALGGDVVIAESVPGCGSVFEIQVECEAVTRAPACLVPEEDMSRLTGMKVLLAEDAPMNQMLISRFLELSGAEVEVAQDGLEAVRMALTGGHDLILMDVQMPRLDGLAATRMLREKGYTGPIVALSGYVMPEDCAQSLAAGCDAHLGKPVRREELIRQVRACVTRRMLRSSAAVVPQASPLA